MAAPTLTYTLSNGSTADASQVMQDFNDLLNAITDGTKDLSFAAITCSGTATLNGHCNFGNSSSDDLIILASLAGTLPVKTNAAYDIGSSTLGLASVYIGGTGAFTTRILSGATSSYSITLPTGVPLGADYVARFSTAGVMTFGHPGPTGATGADSDTTLTLSSSRIQVVTPTATRAYTLPTTNLKIGDQFTFINNAATSSSFLLNIKSSGGNQIVIVYPGQTKSVVALQDTPTTAAHWMENTAQVGQSVEGSISASASAAGTYDTPVNITLTPGVWDVSAQVTVSASTNLANCGVGVSTDSGANTFSDVINGVNILVFPTPTGVAGASHVRLPALTIATSTVYYAKVTAGGYTGSNPTFTGRVYARRLR